MAKKKLTNQQEFEIMKLVLDKFLWVGVAIMVLGLYTVVTSQSTFQGFAYMLGGAVVLLLFMMLLIREYEVLK
ncbi:MAG: hypothetical protein ACQESF_05000 [Nanobdellota archaeon]